MASVGQIIPISVKLHNQDPNRTTKFVRALVKNPAGTLISTLALTHSADGEYSIDTFPFPDHAFVTVTYEVYRVALPPSGSAIYDDDNHIDGYDKFSRTEPVVLDIQSTVNGLASGGFSADLELEIEGDDLELEADPDPELDLEADQEELILETEQDESTIEVESVEEIDVKGGCE